MTRDLHANFTHSPSHLQGVTAGLPNAGCRIGWRRNLARHRGVEDVYRTALPQLSDEVFLTDSGLETDLIFHGGFDLPEFAAFVLVDDARGTAALDAYLRRHVDIAVQHGCGVILEAPTWRASRDWGSRIGYPPAELRRANC